MASTRRPRFASWIAPMLVAAALGRIGSSAQNVRLNGPLPQGPGDGDVLDFALSPDGTRVVYRADQLDNGVYELFGAPADGSAAPVRLNRPLTSGENVGGGAINIFGAGDREDFRFGAAGRVVYIADQATSDVDEIFSVPADRSLGPRRLNHALGTADVVDFELSADGSVVVYQTTQPAGLFRVPIDRSAAPIAFTPNHVPWRFWISPDGEWAAFNTGADTDLLYAVPTDGSAAPIELDSTTPSGFGYVYFDELTFSADGSHVVYADVEDFDGEIEVDFYAAPTDGSQATTKLNIQPLDGYSVLYAFDGEDHLVHNELGNLYSVALDGTGRQQINPPGWLVSQLLASDGEFVVFPSGSFGQYKLFRAPIAGGPPVTLYTSADFNVRAVEILGSWVVAVATVGGVTGLYSLPLQGGEDPVLLASPLNNIVITNNAESFLSLRPGGQDLVVRYALEETNVTELFVVPLDGSAAPRKLNDTLVTGGDVNWSFNTADGERAVYLADQNGDEIWEVFGAALDEGDPLLQYNDLLFGGPVLGDVFSFLPISGARVVYRADQDVDDFIDLLVVPSDGSEAPLRLTTDVPGSFDVHANFTATPAGDRVLFQVQGGGATLYSTPSSGAGPAVVLDTSPAVFPLPVAFVPGGTHVVYRKGLPSSGGFALVRTVLDDSLPPITLADPPGTRTVSALALTPDGSGVIYRADQDANLVFELYRVPSDGSAGSVKLNASPATGGDVDTFQVSPDGSRVAYRADQAVNDVFELFSAPADASAPAVKLNGTLVAGGDVTEIAVTSDSARAVYRADQDADGRFELYSAPLDASAPAARLNAALVPGGNVATPFALGTAGRVLYVADQDTDEVFELYSVPSDGSASPVRLNGPLAVGGDVGVFAISPDQSRAVYIADERASSVDELFSVSITGGPAVPLVVLPSTADVMSFQVDPDSESVVFRADGVTNDVFELFRVPLDGSAPPKRISVPLSSPFQGVQTDFTVLPGGSVLYRADPDGIAVVELFHFLNLWTPGGDKFGPAGPPSGPISLGQQ